MRIAVRAFVPFRTPVRGYRFAAQPLGAPEPGRGMSATLRREPGHPLDPLAVAVWVGDEQERPWRIGYLERAVAARLAPAMDAGQRIGAMLDGWLTEPGGRWLRPLLAVHPIAGSVADRVTPLAAARPAQTVRRVVPVDQSRKTA